MKPAMPLVDRDLDDDALYRISVKVTNNNDFEISDRLP